MSISFPSTIKCLPPKEHGTRGLALWLLCLAPLAFGCLSLWLGQDSNWDLRNYHWYNAYAFLTGRRDVDLLPSQTPWFYNPMLDLPFYVLATHMPAKLVGFILGAVQGLNFVLLFMLAYAGLVIPNSRQKLAVCAALATLGMLGGGGIALIGTTFYDNVTSLGLFLSALLVVRHHERLIGAPWRDVVVAAILFGIPAGMAMGFKLPCFTFCSGMCMAHLFMSGAWQRRLLIGFLFGVGVLTGVAITLGHWAWYLETHFGSPLFPYFNQIFQSPLAPPSSARDMQYVPRSLHDFFLFPFVFTDSPYRTGEIPWRDWRILILYVLLPLAILLRLVFGRSPYRQNVIATPFVARYLLWSIGFAYFLWLAMFGIYRYIVPVEMVAPLLIVFAVGLLPIKPWVQAMLAGFLLAVIALSVQGGNWGRHNVWPDRYVDIEVPPLADADHTMLLMAGFEPYSYAVTQFPPQIPVIRIQSNFASPDQEKAKLINERIKARLDAHNGRFLLLIPNWQHKMAASALGVFTMTADWKACQSVTDRLNDGTVFDLCPVSRSPE